MTSSFILNKTCKQLKVLFLLPIGLFFGCTIPQESPITYAGKPLMSYGFIEQPSNLPLKIYQKKISNPISRIRIYIESDGATWLLNNLPPSSPSPNRAFSASLAVQDINSQIAYISRPCQFIKKSISIPCPSDLWQKGRFSNEAIHIVSNAVDLLKFNLRVDSATPIELIGYSGGGVMATLLAAKRRDVVCLVTLAAPLDLDNWTRLHQVATLDYSIKLTQLSSPEKNRLQSIRQFHFYGKKDLNVPFETTLKIQSMFGLQTKWLEIEDFDHQKDWILAWPDLLRTTCLGQ